MKTLEQLNQEIESLKARNKKVESDKAWEVSTARKILIASFTYLVITLFFIAAEFPRPFISALVPTLGFVLSTLTIPIFKKYWIEKIYNKKRNT